jgi:hypothetical protein
MPASDLPSQSSTCEASFASVGGGVFGGVFLQSASDGHAKPPSVRLSFALSIGLFVGLSVAASVVLTSLFAGPHAVALKASAVAVAVIIDCDQVIYRVFT